ncbi:hypothetical protein [Bacillus basilensis]|uniref:hypothetical protein n=1 Tax=Bacillus basilensis TaxID=3243721 RepID=UPI003D654F96
MIPKWKQKKVASIGWTEFDNLQAYFTRETLIPKAHGVYEDEKPSTRLNWSINFKKSSFSYSTTIRVMCCLR